MYKGLFKRSESTIGSNLMEINGWYIVNRMKINEFIKKK